MKSRFPRIPACLLTMILAACGPAAGDAEKIEQIADDYFAMMLEHNPEAAYFSAVDINRHDGLRDNSPAGVRSRQAAEDRLLARLDAIDVAALKNTPGWIAAVLMLDDLESRVATRVCRKALWDVSQMDGWHLAYTELAELQPIDTARQRQEALVRWSSFPAYVDQEIANLETGIDNGYSAPRSVARRVLEQLDGILSLPDEETPYYSPASRSDDAEFRDTFGHLVTGEILPAIRRFRDYLAGEYLPAARESLSILSIPNGEACYAASLRAYTTLDMTGEEIHELGQATVSNNRAHVIALGKKQYAVDDFADIVRAARDDPRDHFATKEELLTFSEDAVRRAAEVMPDWVGNMPSQAVSVVPFPEHEEGTGRSAHYRPGNAGRPAEYRIPLHNPGDRSRGNSEATAFHETWPGHHLQVAAAQAVDGLHPVTRLIWFSGPGEGWARYSEALAEEMGLYETTTGPILRRAWPARGMVVDTGLHLKGWTREQAREYMLESGRFPESQGDSMVDRIAILPGQLTAYDAGGLAILKLRQEAEAALGDDFDVRVFHDRVLENGTIPLEYLRQHVGDWISASCDDCRIAE